MAHCMRHFEEPYVADCRTCQRPFCSRCLVFPNGPTKPPYCIACALNASGVRNKSLVRIPPTATVGAPTDRRHERAARKEQRKAAKAEARAARAEAKAAPVEAEAARSSHVPAPADMAIPAARYSPPSAGPPERPIS